jgi:hypothetical protein
MSAYQVPQFLDSGDKILFGMNLRQFGYALGGFLFGMLLFSVTGSLLPRAGVFAWVPSIPVFLMAAYLAFGRFNGRDSDIYVIKIALFFILPKQMTYQRMPYTDDLTEKMNEWTYDKISKRWQAGTSQKKSDSENEYSQFTTLQNDEKVEKIKRLGKSIDQNVLNSMLEVEQNRLKMEENISMINNLKSGKNPTSIINEVKQKRLETLKKSSKNNQINNQNFFDIKNKPDTNL